MCRSQFSIILSALVARDSEIDHPLDQLFDSLLLWLLELLRDSLSDADDESEAEFEVDWFWLLELLVDKDLALDALLELDVDSFVAFWNEEELDWDSEKELAIDLLLFCASVVDVAWELFLEDEFEPLWEPVLDAEIELALDSTFDFELPRDTTNELDSPRDLVLDSFSDSELDEEFTSDKTEESEFDSEKAFEEFKELLNVLELLFAWFSE